MVPFLCKEKQSQALSYLLGKTEIVRKDEVRFLDIYLTNDQLLTQSDEYTEKYSHGNENN